MNFLFDLYGTLVDILTDEDSERFWSEVSVLLYGTPAEGDGARRRYLALCAEAAEALPKDGEPDLLAVFARLAEESGSRNTPLSLARGFRRASILRLRLFDGAKQFLAGAKARGAGCYLLSNAQACFTRDELAQLSLDGDFDGILLSSEAGCKKPSPRFFRTAFERFGLSPGDCYYIGNDLRDDVGGAHSVGMRCAYIPTEQSGRYASAEVPDLLARDLFSLAEELYPLCRAGRNE